MAAGAGDRQAPGDQVPGDRADECGHQDGGAVPEDQVVVDDLAADGRRNGDAEDQGADEVGRGREQDREFGLDRTRRDRCRDCVCGVMEAVDVVEGDGQRKDGEQRQERALRQPEQADATSR